MYIGQGALALTHLRCTNAWLESLLVDEGQQRKHFAAVLVLEAGPTLRYVLLRKTHPNDFSTHASFSRFTQQHICEPIVSWSPRVCTESTALQFSCIYFQAAPSGDYNRCDVQGSANPNRCSPPCFYEGHTLLLSIIVLYTATAVCLTIFTIIFLAWRVSKHIMSDLARTSIVLQDTARI